MPPMQPHRHVHRHSHTHSRRSFLHRSAGSLLLGLAPSFQSSAFAQARNRSYRYDLVVKGGRVIDPAQGIDKVQDVAVSNGKIARLADSIPASEALHIVDAAGRIVTPGWIDIHVHVYDGVAPLSIPADPNCVAKGVTTVVDAGSAGAGTFPGLRKYVINVADTRVLALLNISVIGQSSLTEDNLWGELLDLRYANVDLAIRTIERHRDVIVGVKARLTDNIAGDHDLEALRRAREAADAVNLPLMVHIGGSYSSVPQILQGMKPGDVITHSFRGGEGGILNDEGRVMDEVLEAVDSGVHLDIGHGAGSFSFDTAEKALAQGLLPGTISSDVHQFNIYGPVFDLATTVSKFLHLGLTLDQAIERVTANPSRVFGALNGLGSLREGGEADISVFELERGSYKLTDALGATRTGAQMLKPVATIRAGNLYGASSIPVERL